MKRKIFLWMLMAVLLPVPVHAQSSETDDAMTFSSDGYEYIVDENGYATLTKYLGKDTEVIIPDSVGGHIVTCLGDGTFFVNQVNIESVQLSRDIQDIGDYAFLNDTMERITADPQNDYYTSEEGILFNKDETEIAAYPIGRPEEEYTIPDGVSTVGSYSFYAARNLKKVNVSDTVKNIQEFAFALSDNLESVRLPDGVELIGANAFYSCNLSEILLPESLKEIGETAFNGNPVSEITIPKNVEKIGDNPFMGTNLAEINVEDGNDSYYGKDGVLLDRKENELVCYPCKKEEREYQIPDGISCINTRAFTGNKNIEKIVIPDSVTEIRDAGFSNCTSLKEAVLPGTIQKLGKDIYSMDSSMFSLFIPSSLAEYDNEFLGGSSFVNIEVAPDCTVLKNMDQTIFSADGKTLIRHYNTASTEYTVPAGTEALIDSSFERCKVLKKITLPDTVKTFGDYTFSYVMSLPKDLVVYLNNNPEAEKYLDEKEINHRKVGEGDTGTSDTVSVEYHDSVPNDVTGNWRLAIVDTSHFVTDYALNYYNSFCKNDSEIHGIINRQDNTTTSINKMGNILLLTVHQYVAGEENDAKLLYSGTVLSEYEINMDTGAVTQTK